MAKKRKLTKNDMYAVFPVYYGTREQNSSPYLASIVRQYNANGRLFQDPEILLISLDWLSLD